MNAPIAPPEQTLPTNVLPENAPETLLEVPPAPPSPRRRRKWGALLRYSIEALRPKRATAVLQPEAKPLPRDCPRHVILVHGHNCLPSFLHGLLRSLRGVPGADEWRFWLVEYDTHWKPFTRSAREIVRTMQQEDYNFEEAILVGYSMGGLVVRQMVVEGFPCKALFALCSPHLGYVPWIPFGEAGSLSISVLSRRLQILNRNRHDRAARSKYHFVASDYEDMLGQHAHDGLVPRRSALGETLGPLGSRHTVHLNYRYPPGIDPHIRFLRHQNLTPVLELCEELFSSTKSTKTHEGS